MVCVDLVACGLCWILMGWMFDFGWVLCCWCCIGWFEFLSLRLCLLGLFSGVLFAYEVLGCVCFKLVVL